MTTLAANVRSVLLSASEVGPLHTLPPRAVLFHQNQDAVGAFLIEGGLVKLTRTSDGGRKLILSAAGPHQLVGEECLVQSGGGYLGDCACVTEVTGYHIPVFTIRRLLAVSDLAHALTSYLALRNREAALKFEMRTFRNVEYRLLHGLATLAALVTPSLNGSSFPIPMIQAEIASYVGANRETTSAALGDFKSRRLVTLSRRLITTVHPDILIRAAEDKLARTNSASSPNSDLSGWKSF